LPPPEPPSRERFAPVSSVVVDDPRTWDGKLFLTFDIDWAHDPVIEDSIDLVEAAGVPVTWFVTHETPVLERLRANPAFELGIHPNFLPLLMQGNPSNGRTAEEVVDRLLTIVPEARSVRSHSLVQSGRLLQLFRNKGLTHEANAFVPEQSGIELKPWIDWFGSVRVPYSWEDDFWCAAGASLPGPSTAPRGIRGFDFHPIHVYLNTETLVRYENSRPDAHDPERLLARRYQGHGVRSVLRALLGLNSADAEKQASGKAGVSP
jgi:hypothetical protein